MKRIDCLLLVSNGVNPSQYGVLPYFTKKFHEALLSLGINSRFWEVEKHYPGPFIQELLEDPPLCTISFNSMIANDQGLLICEDTGIPHVNIVVDAIYYFFGQIGCRKGIFTCIDRTDTVIYEQMGFRNIFFLPHATEKIESVVAHEDKKFDVVMLASCIDYEEVHKLWVLYYSAELCQIMNEAVEIIIKYPQTPSYQAFITALDHSKKIIGNIPLIFILHDIDLYIRGIDRVNLIRSIKNARIDIFGSEIEGGDWKKYLNQSNVVIHGPIPFNETVEVIKQAKIVLNSCPTIKDGAHERVFTALASGALVLSSSSQYLREQFPQDAIIFYDEIPREKVNSLIDDYLENPSKRASAIELSGQIVMEQHTWEQRAKQLIVKLLPILEGIHKSSD